MVATMNQTQGQASAASKFDKFGEVTIGRDLLPPYVGKIVSWDVVDREITIKNGENAGQTRSWDELMFVIDPLTTAIKTTDGYARPAWKRTFTKQGKVPPNCVYGILLGNLAQVFGFPIKTSADLNRTIGMIVQVEQVEAEKDARFKVMGAGFMPKEPVTLLAKAPANWEDQIPADLDEQKAAKMAEAVAAQEAKRQNEAASTGEEVQAQAVEEEAEAVSYDLDEGTVATLVSWLDGKEVRRIGMLAYQAKDLKAALDPTVFAGLQNKQVQEYLIGTGALTEGKDGLYHAGG